MDLTELRTAIRKGGWLIIFVVAVCTAAAIVVTKNTEPRYESEAQLFVAAQARDFSEQRAPSYAGLATSPNVTTPVIAELGLDDTSRELGKRISASAPPDTVLIDLTVSDSDAARAQRTGEAVARQLISLVGRLEPPNASGKPSVRLFVSSAANLPADPVSPNLWVNVAAGLLLGLLLGVLAAIARGRLDRTIMNVRDLPERLRDGVLAAIPIDAAASTAPAAGLGGTSPARAEALRRLRANVRFVDPDQPPRSIVVTSSLPGEGASTTALGLATAMAESGIDVVLVEADMRRPNLARLLGLSHNAGVAGCLAGTAEAGPLLQPCVAAQREGRLRVLVAGPATSTSSELLGSPRMPRLIEQLTALCDIVIIDAPPLLAVTDAALLGAVAEGVVLVVRMGYITHPELERSVALLTRAGAGVLGIVANAVTDAGAAQGRHAYPAHLDHAAMRASMAPAASPAPAAMLPPGRPPAAPTLVAPASPQAAAPDRHAQAFMRRPVPAVRVSADADMPPQPAAIRDTR